MIIRLIMPFISAKVFVCDNSGNKIYEENARNDTDTEVEFENKKTEREKSNGFTCSGGSVKLYIYAT